MLWRFFLSYSRVNVGLENLVSFWQDIWCGDDFLILQFPHLYSLFMNKDTSVVIMRNICFNGWAWNLHLCQ